jgi:D-alanyl-D-alanine carboxypeptidase
MSRDRRSRAAVVVLLLLVASCSGGGSSPSAVTSKKRAAVHIGSAALGSRLAALVREAGAMGAIAGVAVGGGAPTIVATGTDPHSKAALETADSFRIASVTKTFVGALALRLVQQGKLALDDPVSKYEPDWPRGDEITIRMLLSHRSGLAPWGSDRGSSGPYSDAADTFGLAHYGKKVLPDEVLAVARDRPLLFAPGTATSYSNINTILLGHVISTITGRTLGTELHRELLDPLKLTGTRYGAEEPVSPMAGVSDLVGPGSQVDTGPIDFTGDVSIVGAAGAMVSTIDDLLTWGDSFLRSRVAVKDPLASEALRIGPGGTGLGVVGYSGDGFCALADSGCPQGTAFSAVGGTGVFSGARTILAYDPSLDAIVAVVVNRDGTPGLERFVRDVFTMVEGAE